MDGMAKTADKFYLENNLQDLNAIGYLNKDDLKLIRQIDNVKDAEFAFFLLSLPRFINDNDTREPASAHPRQQMGTALFCICCHEPYRLPPGRKFHPYHRPAPAAKRSLLGNTPAPCQVPPAGISQRRAFHRTPCPRRHTRFPLPPRRSPGRTPAADTPCIHPESGQHDVATAADRTAGDGTLPYLPH